LSEKTIHGAKSEVLIGDDRVRKTYRSADQRRSLIEDPILRVNSSKNPPRYYYRKEGRVLDTLSEIPDEDRLSPKLYARDDPALTLEMERIVGQTYRDILTQTLNSGGDPIRAIEDIPQLVAGIHKQLNSCQAELINADNKDWGHHGLKMRGLDEERSRVWHYLRAIIYSMSLDSEMVDLRESQEVDRAKANRKIREYLSKKGIEEIDFTNRFVERNALLLYGTTQFDLKGRALLSSGRLSVVHGDLGPQHIFKSGRYIDLDEARLASPEIDLVSALYNVFTSPKNEEQELRMIEVSFKYLQEMLGREPSAQERAAFLTRMVESRLKDISLRLFAADCKSTVGKLRELTEGHPDYDTVPDDKLRETLLRQTFVEGLPTFFDFYTRGAGKEVLNRGAPDLAHMLYDQMIGIKGVFDKTRVFEGIADGKTVYRLERLLGTPYVGAR
jgi:hypothetical protein